MTYRPSSSRCPPASAVGCLRAWGSATTIGVMRVIFMTCDSLMDGLAPGGSGVPSWKRCDLPRNAAVHGDRVVEVLLRYVFVDGVDHGRASRTADDRRNTFGVDMNGLG